MTTQTVLCYLHEFGLGILDSLFKGVLGGLTVLYFTNRFQKEREQKRRQDEQLKEKKRLKNFTAIITEEIQTHYVFLLAKQHCYDVPKPYYIDKNGKPNLYNYSWKNLQSELVDVLDPILFQKIQRGYIYVTALVLLENPVDSKEFLTTISFIKNLRDSLVDIGELETILTDDAEILKRWSINQSTQL